MQVDFLLWFELLAGRIIVKRKALKDLHSIGWIMILLHLEEVEWFSQSSVCLAITAVLSLINYLLVYVFIFIFTASPSKSLVPLLGAASAGDKGVSNNKYSQVGPIGFSLRNPNTFTFHMGHPANCKDISKRSIFQNCIYCYFLQKKKSVNCQQIEKF